SSEAGGDALIGGSDLRTAPNHLLATSWGRTSWSLAGNGTAGGGLERFPEEFSAAGSLRRRAARAGDGRHHVPGRRPARLAPAGARRGAVRRERPGPRSPSGRPA